MEHADFGTDNSTRLLAGADVNGTVAPFGEQQRGVVLLVDDRMLADWRAMRDMPLHVLAIVFCTSLFVALVLLLVALRVCCCVVLRVRRRRRSAKTLHCAQSGGKPTNSGRSGSATTRVGGVLFASAVI